MSKRIDAERKQMSEEDRIERAKERLRFAQEVLRLYAQGVKPADIARQLGRSADKIWKTRVWLGLVSGTQWRTTGKRTGRLNTVSAIQGVTP